MLRRKVSGFHIFNYAFLSLLILVCIAPILHVIALSFSQKIEAVAGHVGLLPVGFNVEAYRYVMEDSQFWTSLGVTLLRVVIGVPVNIFLVVMTAYPLSKSNSRFHARTVFAWFFAFTMYFSGGQIPLYIVISKLKMINTIWALTLPGAMNVSYMILMLNFFRGIPTEIEDAATIDGANRFQRIIHITLPSILDLVVIMFILSVGNMMNANFDQIFNLYSAPVYKVADVIDTYVYRLTFQSTTVMDYGFSTAVGLFKNVINFALILAANWASKAAGGDGIM